VRGGGGGGVGGVGGGGGGVVVVVVVVVGWGLKGGGSLRDRAGGEGGGGAGLARARCHTQYLGNGHIQRCTTFRARTGKCCCVDVQVIDKLFDVQVQ
jgi:hypothetical protein